MSTLSPLFRSLGLVVLTSLPALAQSVTATVTAATQLIVMAGTDSSTRPAGTSLSGGLNLGASYQSGPIFVTVNSVFGLSTTSSSITHTIQESMSGVNATRTAGPHATLLTLTASQPVSGTMIVQYSPGTISGGSSNASIDIGNDGSAEWTRAPGTSAQTWQIPVTLSGSLPIRVMTSMVATSHSLSVQFTNWTPLPQLPLVNAGFENGLAGWTATGDVHTWLMGSRSGLWNCVLWDLAPVRPSISQRFAANAGDTYALHCYGMWGDVSPGSDVAEARIEFLDALGAVTGSASTTVLDASMPSSTWIGSETLMATAPSGTVAVRVTMLGFAPVLPVAARCHFDDISFARVDGCGAFALPVGGTTRAARPAGTCRRRPRRGDRLHPARRRPGRARAVLHVSLPGPARPVLPSARRPASTGRTANGRSHRGSRGARAGAGMRCRSAARRCRTRHHSRLQRAHAQLRRSLDRSFGAGAGWRGALLPLPLVAPSLTSPLVLAMNVKAVSVIAALAAGSAALLLGYYATADSGSSVVEDQPMAPAGESVSLGQQPATTAAPALRVAVDAQPDTAPPDAGQRSRLCSGKVVDAEGRALPEIHVEVGGQRIASDGAGAFRIATQGSELLRVRADEPGWSTVLEGHLRAGDAPPPVLVVVAPAIRLAGSVRGSNGEPVRADVRAVLPEDLRSRLHGISDASGETTMSVRTGDDGMFVLAAAAVRGAELSVFAEGCLPHRRQLPAADAADLDIVLERLDRVAGSLQGQVVDLAGRPVAGARVGLGSALARSDEQGNFVIVDDGKAAALSASAPGFRRGLLERPAAGFAPFVFLSLGSTPLSISGRVVDENGKGLAGIVVWPSDPTVLCASPEPMPVEGIAAGCCTPDELRGRFERGEFAGQRPEDVVRSTPTTMWPWVSTDDDGAFTLGGLEDRPYRLRAMDRDTVLMMQQEGIAAGSDGARLVLDQSLLFEQVEGVVVTAAGSPIPGVRIAVQLDTQSLQGNTLHGRALATDTTDRAGRFELRRVPKLHAYFRLDGDDILPSEPGRHLAGGILALSDGRPHELRLEARVRVHMQVELLEPSRADAVSVLDGEGKPVALHVFQGNRRRSSDRLRLAEGRSPVCVVPDTARTLVLWKADAEVGRQPLQLRAGGVNTVQW